VSTEYQPPTARDLLAALSALPAEKLDLPVALAKDEEGNGFEFWGGDVIETLMDKHERDTTWHTPEQWAEEMAKPDSQFDPEDDAPPEIDDEVIRVLVVWP
jgi:hypothetical protein